MVKSDEGVNDGSSNTEKKNDDDDPELRGISVSYITNQLMKEVVDAKLEASSKIYELEDLSDLDHDGLIRRKGANKDCPITNQRGAAYVHSIDDPKAIGPANIMLSYAWGYTIGDVVDTLQVYCADNGKDPEDVFVWICCLCVNQHRVIEMKRRGENVPFDEFHSVFEKRVKKIGHIVAMMAPWQEPFYLTRIWCVFEMFTAQNNGCKVTIIMPSSERVRFIEGLTNEDDNKHINALFSALAKTDVTKAEASVPSDLTAILKIVEEVGYADFNKAVSGLLREWAIGVVTAAVEEGKSDLEDDNGKKRQGELLNKVADLLCEIGGNRGRALLFAEDALVLNEAVYGRENVHSARSLRLVGIAFLHSDTYPDNDKLETLREALTIFERVHKGRDNEDAADVLFQIGQVLNRKRDYDESLKAYGDSLSIYEKLFGEESIKTVKTRGGVSVMLYYKGEMDEYLRLNELNLAIEIMCLGEEHPSAATSMNNIGVAYTNIGEYEKALEKYKAALTIAEKVYGNDHPTTESRRDSVDRVTRQIKHNQS